MEGRRVFAWSKRNAREILALVCTALLAVGDPGWFVRNAAAQDAAPAAAEESKLSSDQLDSLVAPLALYPDPLLAQTLAASTYPLEIIQLQQWLGKHKDLKGKALTDAVMKENWDPSVQAMSAFPDVVKQLADNIKWTSELGNAFLAQQSDVMDAVQRMRAKAKNNGNLKTTEQQKVETKTIESKQVIVIEPAKTEVVYVPSYNPTVVYGPPVVAYPPVYYPPPPPPGAYVATAAISFGVGMMVGAAMSGGWGWGCGWGHNDVNVNVNNNYNRNTNINRQNVNNQIASGNKSWQHNPQHRGGAPYSDRATANKYGGNTRGASMSDRQASARQNQARNAGTRQQPGVSDRAAGGGRSSGGRDMASKPSTRQSGGLDRGSGGGDRVGSRDLSSGSGGSGAFGSGGSSMSSARSSSARGASSMSSSRGGGGSGGGGSRGGRGGGGRRR